MGPTTRGDGHLEPIARTAATLATTVLILAAGVPAAPPGFASAPTAHHFTITSVRCTIATELVSGELNLSHSSTGAGAPGGDVILWAAGADPATDPPLLSGYSPTITRDGDVLTGSITPTGPGGGQGLAVAGVSYAVTLGVAGDTATEQVRGAIVDSVVTTNQRFRLERQRTPVHATGIVGIDGIGTFATVCSGEEVVERTLVTAPSVVVGHGDLLLSATCVSADTDRVVLIDVVDGEVTVVVLEVAREPTFGAVGGDVGRRRVSATVPLTTVDGLPDTIARVDLSVRKIDRTTERRTEDGSRTVSLEHVVLTGSVDTERWAVPVVDCVGVRGTIRTRS